MTCFRLAPFALALMLPAASFAQTAPAMTDGTGDASAMLQKHAAMMGQADTEPGAMNPMAGSEHAMTVQEGGQSAFATIQEIVMLLAADPNADWASVDIEALRQHLIDMDNVTLRAVVTAIGTPTGAQFAAGSDDPAVAASIRRMVLAHAATMNGANGWALQAMATDRGAELMVTGAPEDAVMIQGLGFIGILTLGMHHQAHHLALATGMNPHKQ